MDDNNKLTTAFVWIIQFATAFTLLKAAIMKFWPNPMVIEMFSHIGMEPEGRVIIGILELTAGVLLLIPHSIVFGAFLGLGIMSGAIIGHLTNIGIEGIHMASIVFFGCLLIIYIRRSEASIFRNMLD